MIRNKDIAKIWVYNAGIDRTWQDKAYGVRKVNDLNEQIMFNKQGEDEFGFTFADEDLLLEKFETFDKIESLVKKYTER